VFDVFVGGGDVVEGESFGDGDVQGALEKCAGEFTGGVGFHPGREVVAAEHPQGGVGEPECPVVRTSPGPGCGSVTSPTKRTSWGVSDPKIPCLRAGGG
jgi:hypothetical protein